MIKAVNDTAERDVKLIQDFNDLLTMDKEQKPFLLRFLRKYRKLCIDFKKEMVKGINSH